MMPCHICGVEVRGSGAEMYDSRKRGRAYCSAEHAAEHHRRASVESGKKLGLRFAALSSDRMRKRNPMRDPKVRAKASATLRAIGHKPPIRGGNGTGATIAQVKIREALGSEWEIEFTIGTGKGARALGLPGHYKVDVALPRLKIAVEIDGGSHCSIARRKADERRDAYLAGLGWRTFRFSNREAMERTAACAVTVLSTTSK